MTSGAAAEPISEQTLNPTLISKSPIVPLQRKVRKLFYIVFMKLDMLGLVSGVGCAAWLQNCSVADS